MLAKAGSILKPVVLVEELRMNDLVNVYRAIGLLCRT